MRGVNKVILIGNMGSDVELKFLPNGDPVASVSLATSETWKDKQTGQPQERTEWHRLSVFGRLAEVFEKYTHKGSKIYIEGKLRTRKWQDANGNDRYMTEIIVGEMQMLDSKSDDSQARTPPASRQPQSQAGQDAVPPVNFDDFDEDIPF